MRSSQAASCASSSDAEEYVVATKVRGRTMPGENGRGLSRKHVLASIDASLQRLELEYVDLYQIHRWDDETPIEETMEDSTTSSGPGRRATSAPAACAPGSSRRPSVWPDPVRLDAEPLQPDLPRGGTEMIPQCIDMDVGVLRGVRSLVGCWRGRTSSGEQLTARSRTDPFLDSLYRPDLDVPVIDRVGEIAAERGVPPHRSRSPGSCTSPASRRRSWRQRRSSTSRTRSRGGALAERGRDRAARGRVCAAPVAGIEL